jgi:hypothetical protein
MKHMQKAKKDEEQLPVSSLHPFLSIYKTGRASVQIPEKSFNDIKPIKLSQDISSADTKGIASHAGIDDEIKFIIGLSAEAEDDTTNKVPRAHGASSSANGEAQIPTRAPTRRAMQWQMAKLCIMQDALSSSTQQLIDQFVLKHYPHPLLRKCWGTLEAFNEVRSPLSLSK